MTMPEILKMGHLIARTGEFRGDLFHKNKLQAHTGNPTSLQFKVLCANFAKECANNTRCYCKSIFLN